VLTIQVDGPAAGRRGLLTAIRGHLRAIERTIPGLAVNERVPVPGHPTLWVSYDHLVQLEAHGIATVIPEGVVAEFRVGELLSGVERREDRQPVAREVVASAPELVERQPSWSAARLAGFAGVLVVALAAGVGAFFLMAKALGGVWGGIAGTTVAIVVMVVIGLFLLRVLGLLSEKGLLDGLKQTLSKIPSAQDK
jgi:hypothetical protein